MSAPTPKCFICKQSDDDDLEYGEWKTLGDISVHYFCLLLSKRLLQNGNGDEGILGFLLPDIHACEQLTRTNRCVFCKKSHASVWCDEKRCKQFYHVPCGMKNGCLFKFVGEYQSFCPRHHGIDNSEFTIHSENDECFICQEPIGKYSPITSIPSCCNRGWFHRTCIKMAAVNSALLLHCPMCGGRKEYYQQFIAQRGIYVPHQDAAWERSRSAFENLLFQYKRCDANICQCERGQHYYAKRGDWKIIVCQFCGSKGTHKKCSNLETDRFECEVCKLANSQKAINAESENLVDSGPPINPPVNMSSGHSENAIGAESPNLMVSTTSMQKIEVHKMDIDDLSDDEQSDDEQSISSEEVVWKLVKSDLVEQKPLSWCLVKKNRTNIVDPFDREKLWRKMSKRKIDHFFRSKYALRSVDQKNVQYYHYPKNDGWTATGW